MKTRTILTIIYCCAFSGYVSAQTPGFNYQAVLRNAAGETMTNAEVTLHFSLIDGSTEAVIYKENQVLTTDELGILTCMVGAGAVESGNFTDITGVQDLNIKIEAELPGETGMTEIGTSKLGVIPFALYGRDEDADPNNEMQELSLVDDSLKISGSEGVSLEAIKSPLVKIEGGYQLPLGGPGRSGESVDQVNLTGNGVNIMSPNFLQNLLPNGMSIESGANKVNSCVGILGQILDTEKLSAIANASIFTFDEIFNSMGEVTSIGDYCNVEFLTGSGSGGTYRSYSGTETITYQSLDECRQLWIIAGILTGKIFTGVNGTGWDLNSNLGTFAAGSIVTSFENALTSQRAATFGGTMSTANDDGLTTLTGALPGFDPANAYNIIFNGQNLGVASTINAEMAGTSSTYGPNGQINTTTGTFSGDANGGALITFDQSGNTGAYVWTKNDGSSQMGADQFIMTAQPPGRSGEIAAFSAPVGGEAAAYDRGTATLVNGEATVICPEHFGWVADEKSMTVTITPLSADSKGIAVIEKSNGGFKVKELNGGTGNYSFDYLVMCKRKGLEDYEVIRKKPQIVTDNSTAIVENLPTGTLNSIQDLVPKKTRN